MAKQARAAQSREQLIDAAVRVFRDCGYLDTTPKDIADVAGLTTGAFYYHFKSKEAVALEIIRSGWSEVVATFRRIGDIPDPGLEDLIGASFQAVDLMNSDERHRTASHLTMAIGHLSPSIRQPYRDGVAHFSRVVLPAAFRDADLRDDVTREEAAEILWIAANGAQLMSDALDQTGPLVFDRMARAWTAVLRAIARENLISRLGDVVAENAARYTGRLQQILAESA